MNPFERLLNLMNTKNATEVKEVIDGITNDLSPFKIGDTVITKYNRVCTITRIDFGDWLRPNYSGPLYHLLDDESGLVHKSLGLDDLRKYEDQP